MNLIRVKIREYSGIDEQNHGLKVSKMLPDGSIARKKTKEEKTKLFFPFLRSESAAVTVIIAILLLGLIFTIVSVVRLEYVPEWKNDAELDHMYDLWDNMIGIKANVDILSRFMESGNYSVNVLSATVPFGGGTVPIFEPSKSKGRLEVNTERCKMTITPYTTNQTINPPYPLECGGISCYSDNSQYPDQIYRYENGALILSDGRNSIMKQSPVFNIEKTGEDNYTVAIRAVQLFGKPNSVSSSTYIPLRLTGLGAMTIYNSSTNSSTSIDAFDLTIATEYPDAWFVYFNEIAQDKGLVYGKDYTVKLIPNSVSPNSVRFSFLADSTKNIESLYVSEAIIGAEIIPLRYQNVMKLNQWYYFNTASNAGIDLFPLTDCGSPVDFSIQNTVGKGLDSKYSQSSNVLTFNLDNNSFESRFGFNGFTEFESQPNSVTILMVYQPQNLNLSYMTIAGKALAPTLADNYKNNWCLYKQTVSGVSITDPSELELNLKINAQTGKKIDVDYLAIYLS